MSGELTITPGYNWLDTDAITTDKLDLSAQPTAAVANASIGKREVIASEVQRLASNVLGGIRATYTTPADWSSTQTIALLATITVPGAGAGMVPVVTALVSKALLSAYVSALNTVQVYAFTVANMSRKIPKGTTIFLDLI